MNVLIVYAHPEPKSFNGAMKDLAVSVLTEHGHSVQVSDLHAMKFKAVGDKSDFLELSDDSYFKYQAEQLNAYEHQHFSSDIQAEQEKLLWADFVIFQSPMWWLSFPAIMKGWMDRVITSGFSYRFGQWFDTGLLKGRKAMLVLTTGGPCSMYTQTGMHGDIDRILYPINHGVLYYVGMEVLSPFIAWSTEHVGQERREEYLNEYRARLLNWQTANTISYPSANDYDESFQLKSKALSVLM